jgi:hypothetical protein
MSESKISKLPKQSNQYDSPNANEYRVLRLIHGNAPTSRAEVVRQTRLSVPTVSKAVAALLGAGLLEEVEIPKMQVRRPPKRLRLARQRSQVLGIVIAPGTCWVVSSGLDGALEENRLHTIRTPDSYDGLIEALAAQA